MALDSLGKILLYIGIIIVLLGAFLLLLAKLPWFGRLPGDFSIQREGWTIYIPITTMVIVSVLLTILLNIIFRK